MGKPAYRILVGLCAEFDARPGTPMRHAASAPGDRWLTSGSTSYGC